MRISDWSSDVCSSDLTPACSKRATDGYAFGVAYPADRSWRAHADRGPYCRHAGPRCLWLVGRGRGRCFRAGGYLRQRPTERTNQPASEAQGPSPDCRSEPMVYELTVSLRDGESGPKTEE